MKACLDPLVGADLASAFFWAFAYALILRRGSLDRASGVPLLALASAITWELVYAVVRPTPELPWFVVPVWLAIDAGILYQYLRYGRADSPAPAWFYVRLVAALTGAFALAYGFIVDWGDRDGVLSGFAVNVVMSLSYVAMVERRDHVRGQSLSIALSKMAGSAFAIPHAYVLHGPLWSLRACMAITVAADVVYAALLYRRCRALGLRPWARW